MPAAKEDKDTSTHQGSGDEIPAEKEQSTSPTTPPNRSSSTILSRLTRPGAAPLFNDSPNARSKTITTASGPDTHGALNQHPSQPFAYSIGVSEDTGSRRTMEDAYSFVADYAGVRGQGYFAIFDGHAGKHAAEWCGAHFHEYLLEALQLLPPNGSTTIPDVLNKTFHTVDSELSRMAAEGQTNSGCTAVTAFLRLEDDKGRQPQYAQQVRMYNSSSSMSVSGSTSSPTKTSDPSESGGLSKLKSAVKSISGKALSSEPDSTVSNNDTGVGPSAKVFENATRKVLYTANAGDARAVLCRGGKAVRLTYDHKGSDKQEAKRIKEAGGFVMNNRVNGVLAVTRSLGDSSMKEFVVGAPYTTETELGEEDEFLIIACDGLWDVAEDQQAVELVRDLQDPQIASKVLVDHALKNYSTDNISVLVVRFFNTSTGLVGPSSS